MGIFYWDKEEYSFESILMFETIPHIPIRITWNIIFSRALEKIDRACKNLKILLIFDTYVIEWDWYLK